jgi:microcystin-dependent protein
LVAGTPYAATYYNVSGEWILRGAFAGAVVPLGVALPFFATALPGSNFAFPFGQAISRTTYAALFTLFGTTYGAGDGATTFNLPDLRGYLLAGKDDMGGAAASRITAAHSGIAGSTLGAAGGAETVTLASGHMPVHSHGVNDPTHAHGVSDPTHAHGVSDPTHAHSVLAVPNQTAGAQSGTGAFGAATQTTISTDGAATGIGIAAAATGISIGNAGSSLEHQNMPPTRICNFIMRIL